MVAALIFGAFALAAECDEFLLSEIDFLAKQEAREFVRNAPYIARRLAMSEEDVAQELRIEAWRMLIHFDPVKATNPRAYFRQKMKWYEASLARKSLTNGKTVTIENQKGEQFDLPAPMEDRMDVADAMTIVQKKLHMLTRADRKYTEMALMGMSPEEISAASGVGLIRVKKAIQVGTRILRQSINPEEITQ